MFKARRRLRAMVHPDLYLAQLGDADRAALGTRPGVGAVLRHHRARGARAGLRISALFNPRWYVERLDERGLSVDRPLLDHFLEVGWDLRIVPTPLFDEDHYRGKHPEVRGWGFEHFLTSGVYDAGRMPTPFGRFHSGVPDPHARAAHRPLLLPSILHRADEFDLATTSWLEEGVRQGWRRLAGLESPRMRALIEKAAAIEPLVLIPPAPRWTGVPPYVHPMLLTRDAAEDVRRLVGRDRAETVVLASVEGARRASGLVLLTQGEGEAPAGAVDLRATLAPLNGNQRVKVLLDAVRGLRARRIVVAGSAAGGRLLDTYPRQLADQAELVREGG